MSFSQNTLIHNQNISYLRLSSCFLLAHQSRYMFCFFSADCLKHLLTAGIAADILNASRQQNVRAQFIATRTQLVICLVISKHSIYCNWFYILRLSDSFNTAYFFIQAESGATTHWGMAGLSWHAWQVHRKINLHDQDFNLGCSHPSQY